MRRLLPLLLTLLFATTLTADDPAERFRQRLAPEVRLGRAMIVHPTQPLTDADRAVLAAKGVEIKHALTGGRYLARMRGDAAVEDERIASVEPLTARHKIHASALRQAGRGKTWIKVHVIFQRDVEFEDARNAILAAGGALPDPFRVGFSPSRRLTVTIAPTALDALAADERVLTVVGVRNWRVETDNATAAAVSRVNEVHAAPYGLTGAGVTVSLFELAAAQQDHVEFGGRLTVNAIGGSNSDKNHATHVAGTIGAAGVSPAAKGMAPAVRIHQQCVETGSNQCRDRDWLEDKEKLLSPLGVLADNNSWGYVLGWTSEGGYPVWLDSEEYFGAYDLIVGAPIDEISNDKGILFIHSAGNDANGTSFSLEFSQHRHVYPAGHEEEGETNTKDVFCYSQNGSGTDCPTTCAGNATVPGAGPRCETVRHDPDLPFDTIGVTAGAKNIITVGSLVASGTNARISDFSSRGPAKDGRIKPEVVARGSNVYSTIPTNAYTGMSGTSMAAPVVTGIAALLIEQWHKTFNGANPTPAQLKAVIIAGTQDLGNPGPDYTYGFGLVNAKSSVDAIIADGGTGARIRNFTFNQGQSFDTNVTLTQAQNLRVVLNWADPSLPYLGGDDIAQKALVNDLDVKVTAPDGTVHLPWVLDRTAFLEHATRGINTTDNVEMVEIPNAAPGVYRVTATGRSVTEGPQTAVLVTSASAAAAAPPCVDPQEVGRTNDVPANATRNLVTGSEVRAAICAAADVDYYTFTATRPGEIFLTVTTTDTPIRFTITGTGVNVDTVVPANTTQRITIPGVTSFPSVITVRAEAGGELGQVPTYTFTPTFGQAGGARRRSVGR